MTVILGLWHLVLEGGKEKSISTPACIQITNVSYGEEITDPNSRDVVKLQFESLSIPDDEDENEEKEESNKDGLVTSTTILCALTPGKVEHASLNIVLDNDAEYTFKLSGKNTVYLTGHYTRQNEDEGVNGAVDEFSEDESSDEDAYDLREVSSDVEIHADDLDVLESDNSRFEEVIDEPEPTNGRKRARPSDSVAEETKAEKKKKSKKLKAEDGKPVEVPVEAPEVKKEKKENKEKKAEETPQVEDKKEKQKKTLANGIVIQDHKVGTGPMAKKGNTVRMRYVGKMSNGKEFDKNVSGKPFTFHLGKGEVIKGWDEGIVGMQVGGERILTIPPALGYGSKKAGTIPPNSTLIFEVKLLGIK